MSLHQIDWRKVKPRGKWVLAKSEPRVKQTRGGILLTPEITGLEKVSVEAAEVLEVGAGVQKAIGYDLKPGERFAFRGFLKDGTSYEFQKAEDGTVVFLIDATDILMVVDKDAQIGVYT